MMNQIGEETKAITYFKKAIAISEQYYGKLHASVARNKNNLGNSLISLGDYRNAEEYLKAALKINKNTYGNKHTQVATVLSNLGNCFFAQNRSKEALHYYLQATEINEMLYKDIPHPDLVRCYINLMSCYTKINNKKVNEYYNKAKLEIKKCYGKSHLHLATAYNHFALSLGPKDLHHARKLLEKASILLENIFGDINHPDIIENLVNLANTYRSLNDLAKAEELIHKAFSKLEKLDEAIKSKLLPYLTHHKGLILFGKGCPLQAKIEFGKAVAHLKCSPVFFNKKKNIRGNLIKCHSQIKLNQERLEHSIQQGHHYLALKKHAQASKFYTMALQLVDPEDVYNYKKLLYRLSLCSYHQQRFAQAYNLVQKALMMDKNYKEAQDLKETLEISISQSLLKNKM